MLLARIAAALLVGFAKFQQNNTSLAYDSIFFALLMSHYALGLTSSRKHLAQSLGSSIWRTLAFAAAMLLAMVLFVRHPWFLVVLFGAHTVFNDLYAMPCPDKRVYLSRILYSGFGYMTFLDQALPFNRMPPWIGLGGMLSSFALLLFCTWRSSITTKEKAHLLLFEGVWLALLPLKHLISISFIEVAFYHVLIWIALPLREFAPNAPRWRRWAAAQLAVFILFLAMTKWVNPDFHLPHRFLAYGLYLGGYLHFFMTFFASRLQPNWLRRLLVPHLADRKILSA